MHSARASRLGRFSVVKEFDLLFSVIRYNSKRYRKKGESTVRKRKKYSPIQKPRPLHLERIMNLKRWTGILLICAAAFMALALFVMWGLPVLFPPEDPEDSLPQATVLPTASPAACTEENDLPVLEDSVNLFVINEDHPADADFAPEEIADFDSVTVDARIVPALTALCDAAKADGVTFKFSGGYVSYAEQESLYNAEVERLIAAGSTKIMAREDAKSTVSAPGTSDLQSGLCVTVQDDPATFSTTDTYGWLQRNMAHYGFVFRYPAGKEDETGIKRNDLVLRYVGTEHAAAIRRLSFCLEEYLRYIGA